MNVDISPYFFSLHIILVCPYPVSQLIMLNSLSVRHIAFVAKGSGLAGMHAQTYTTGNERQVGRSGYLNMHKVSDYTYTHTNHIL